MGRPQPSDPRPLLLALAFVSVSCARSVHNWTAAMVGHAGGGANDRPREIAIDDRRDCNGDLMDGRETDVRISSRHCGACGSSCGGTCTDGRCLTSSSPSTTNPQPPDWRVPTGPLLRAGPIEVPSGDGELSLLAFEFDTAPIESWRYDACVKEGACAARAMAQPAGDEPRAPALGMRWEDADAFCKQRAMQVQTPAQAQAMRESGAQQPGAKRVEEKLSTPLVIAGFRCTRAI